MIEGGKKVLVTALQECHNELRMHVTYHISHLYYEGKTVIVRVNGNLARFPLR